MQGCGAGCSEWNRRRYIKELECVYNDLYIRFHKNSSTVGEFEFHKLYASISKNIYLEQMIDLVCETAYQFMSSSFIDILTQHTIYDSLLDYGEIVRALRARDSIKAKVIMNAHMQRTIDMLKENT